MAADSQGRWVYVVSGKERQLSIVDASRLEVKQRIPLGQGPFKLALAPQFPFTLEWRHLWTGVFVLFLAGFLLCSTPSSACGGSPATPLAAIFILGLGLRLVGLDWGIPIFDAETARATPGLRVSFHLDEDNFLWNLTRIRPESFDFFIPDFHWGTLQYYLVELSLLAAERLGLISNPWRESFLGFHPVEYTRVFVAGRAVSAILGSCSILAAYAIGNRLYGRSTAIVSALMLSLLPLHVVNSHYLTSDVTMVFFLLLAFWGLIASVENPTWKLHGLAGLAAGLAIAAKYNASSLLVAAMIMHLVKPWGGWKRKGWFYVGAALGFLIGEPYALFYRQGFWESVKPYLQPGSLPGEAVPGTLVLLGLELKNMILFGFGIPLILALLLTVVAALVSRGAQILSGREKAGCVWRSPVRESFQALHNPLDLMVAITLLLLFLTIVPLRQPLVRYTLPITVFLIFPLAHFFSKQVLKPAGRILVAAALFFTGLSSLLQVQMLTREHTVNEAFQWIERHVPAGASIKKGWPEIPVLNPSKFRITNFFAREQMADFRDYFSDTTGRPEFADYLLLDSLPTLEMPREFWAKLEENYCLVAEFARQPQLGRFKIPEWNPPHDWKYTHPTISIYRIKRGLKFIVQGSKAP